ncbi:MFS general substrate transporter [Rhodocollybia butyracea]|uniref:MFS general substrate transporter n=1 Tax=Rhodocollybia butyracea TaxID=206335 RepID=A0A9P5PMU1_9AGAR|nr:MFS general substrate transporter [Rhodocollybia butyracea]
MASYTKNPSRSVQQISWGSRISRVIWDRDDKSEEERKFVRRLDWGLMTIACLQYFVKYLDQSNVSNAYVSGMKEALDFQGNEYNTLITMWMVGYVIGQYPATLLMVKVSPSIWLPSCEIFWTVLVMCCAVAKNVKTLYALRFLIGMAEASAYPGMLWVLGSWYGPAELAKRTILFICCSSAGTMFSGYLQAAVYNNLNGIHGRAGWQWLFLIDGVISLPIALAGYFMIPDTPDRVNPRTRFWFREKDIRIGQERAVRFKRAPTKGFTVKDMLAAFKNWVPIAFMVPYTCYVLGLNSFAYMNLWLKAENYTVDKINLIPTGGYALQIATALIYSWVSDAIQMRWPVIAFAALLPFIGNVILAIWPDDKAAIFAGFYLNFTVTGSGAITLAWANELTSYSAEHRAITIGFLNTFSYIFNAWVPNVIFPASQAPHYKTGYKVTTAFFAVYLLATLLNAYLAHRFGSLSGSKSDEESIRADSDEKIDSRSETPTMPHDL